MWPPDKDRCHDPRVRTWTGEEEVRLQTGDHFVLIDDRSWHIPEGRRAAWVKFIVHAETEEFRQQNGWPSTYDDGRWLLELGYRSAPEQTGAYERLRLLFSDAVAAHETRSRRKSRLVINYQTIDHKIEAPMSFQPFRGRSVELELDRVIAVSYTHLTLPTILLV